MEAHDQSNKNLLLKSIHQTLSPCMNHFMRLKLKKEQLLEFYIMIRKPVQ